MHFEPNRGANRVTEPRWQNNADALRQKNG
jgi:hypothetical protein